ncbi:MAG: hypothetical protein ABI867_18195 [Kofleriaceae bacterium]
MVDSVLGRLARDQWVRIHGTPRVTVLVGGSHAREVWRHWLALGEHTGVLLEGELDRTIRDAIAQAAANPREPIAVVVTAAELAAWRTGRTDRYAALVDEGLVHVPAPASPSSHVNLDARSAAEAMLFEALEATPATAGRFALNESLSVRFGPGAAEIDLLSRGDAIAIEIDGVHHFADPECYRRDRRKDVLMQAQGLFVIRLLAEDVMRDVRPALRVVCEALAFRMSKR